MSAGGPLNPWQVLGRRRDQQGPLSRRLSGIPCRYFLLFLTCSLLDLVLVALLRVRNRGKNLIQGRPSSRSFRIDCSMRLLHPQFVWQSLTGFIVWCLSASLHNEAARITRSSPGRRKSHRFLLSERTLQS